jgi:hypothetical protein
MTFIIMKITAYKMVIKRAEDIEEEVNNLIKTGWQPYGSPGAFAPKPQMEDTDTLFQAMVMTDPS